jgi:RNA polymerase sigma factor (sigma-70 family)
LVSAPPDLPASRAAALAIARERLGPASAAAAGGDADLANEFLGHFLGDLMALGRANLGAGLRRHLDTGDLVQSVVKDLWPELAALRFESRTGFLALLHQRLRWKAANRARDLRSGRRREDLRAAGFDPGSSAVAGAGAGPPTAAGAAEERAELTRRVAALPDKERELLRRHLAGEPLASIAESLSVAPAAAKRRLQRALRRVRGG